MDGLERELSTPTLPTPTDDRYRGLFTAMQEALLVAELVEDANPIDFRYVDVNPAAERMLGMSRGQILGRTARELLPAVQEDLIELCARVVRTGVPETREVYEPLVQQHHHSVFFRSAPGQVAVAFTDITHRKRTEEALAAAYASLAQERARLDLLVSSIGDHLASYDRDWRFTFLNEAAAQVLGRPRDELLGRSIWEVFPEAIGNEYYRDLHAAMHQGRAIRSEHYYQPFGRWFENHIYPSSEGVTVFASDITARKRVEAALRESEERFRVMADGLALIVWVHAADGSQEFVNARACEFFGTTREEMSGERWEQLVHPDDLAAYVGGFRAALAEHAPFHATARLRRADGAWRWVESWGRPRFAGSGEFTGLVGASVDITEHLAVQQALRDTDRRKDEFLATLAHELRNPLAAIRNAVGVLQHELGPLAATPAFRVLDRQVVHMVRQVDDLLDLSRISRGVIELKRVRTDLVQIVDQARDALDGAARAREQTVSLSVPSRAVYVEGDPTRLVQVVANLIGNAVKFSGRGGEIRVTLSEEGGSAILRVHDRGIGIPGDQLERIFEMFTQLDTSLERDRSGLGIGLSLVRTLLAQHGGTVKAWSAGIGLGSEFTVTLPLVASAQATAETAAGADAVPVKRRILVVDDNHDAADMLASLLQHAGHEVVTSYDGVDAQNLVARFRPDVVLLDIGMPGLNGYETAQRIRALHRNVRLVALTGWGEAADRRQSQQAGFDAHLVKPASPEQISAALDDPRSA